MQFQIHFLIPLKAYGVNDIKAADPIRNVTQSSVSSLLPIFSRILASKLNSFIRKTIKIESKNIDFRIFEQNLYTVQIHRFSI